MINGHEFIQNFFIKHHFMRYTGVISGSQRTGLLLFPRTDCGPLPVDRVPARWNQEYLQGTRCLKEIQKLRDILRIMSVCLPAYGLVLSLFSFLSLRPNSPIISFRPYLPQQSLFRAVWSCRESSVSSGRLSRGYCWDVKLQTLLSRSGSSAGRCLSGIRKIFPASGISDTGWMTIFGLLMLAVACLSLLCTVHEKGTLRIYGGMYGHFSFPDLGEGSSGCQRLSPGYSLQVQLICEGQKRKTGEKLLRTS